MLVLAAVVVVWLVWRAVRVRRLRTYWRRRGVAGPSPLPVLGSYAPVVLRARPEVTMLRQLYRKHSHQACVGMFLGSQPVLLLRDPDMIKRVFITDFDHFQDRYITVMARKYEKSIFVMSGGQRWRNIRQAIAPAFTNTKIAKFAPMVQGALQRYLRFIDEIIRTDKNIDLSPLQTKFALEMVLDMILGVEANSFWRQIQIERVSHWLLYLETLQLLRIVDGLFPTFMRILAPIGEYTGGKLFSYYKDFIKQLCRSGNIKADTFLSYILHMQEETKEPTSKKGTKVELDDEDVYQLTTTFCLAGFEALAGTTTYMLYELALNQSIQKKVYDEALRAFKKYGELSYEALSELKYTEMVVCETTRKHNVAYVVDRRCTSRYTFPGSGVVIEPGTIIYAPVEALHNDEQYFPNPEQFDPERFSEENRASIPVGVFMPFGEGPRYCVGKHLSKMIIIVSMASLLLQYQVLPSELMDGGLRFSSSCHTRKSVGGVFVKLRKRNGLSNVVIK